MLPTRANADHQFRYCPHEDQDEIINLTLDLAKSKIDLDDDGAALAFACAIYMVTEIPDSGEIQRRKWRGLRTGHSGGEST